MKRFALGLLGCAVVYFTTNPSIINDAKQLLARPSITQPRAVQVPAEPQPTYAQVDPTEVLLDRLVEQLQFLTRRGPSMEACYQAAMVAGAVVALPERTEEQIIRKDKLYSYYKQYEDYVCKIAQRRLMER